MTSLVALDTLWHRQVHIDEKKVEETAADLHLIPLVVSEFTQALAQFPILFSKNTETGQFACVAESAHVKPSTHAVKRGMCRLDKMLTHLVKRLRAKIIVQQTQAHIVIWMLSTNSHVPLTE
jgi:hypothetical protein